jgi:hypothetical protein
MLYVSLINLSNGGKITKPANIKGKPKILTHINSIVPIKKEKILKIQARTCQAVIIRSSVFLFVVILLIEKGLI